MQIFIQLVYLTMQMQRSQDIQDMEIGRMQKRPMHLCMDFPAIIQMQKVIIILEPVQRIVMEMMQHIIKQQTLQV